MRKLSFPMEPISENKMKLQHGHSNRKRNGQNRRKPRIREVPPQAVVQVTLRSRRLVRVTLRSRCLIHQRRTQRPGRHEQGRPEQEAAHRERHIAPQMLPWETQFPRIGRDSTSQQSCGRCALALKPIREGH